MLPSQLSVSPGRLAYRVPELANALGVCSQHVYNLIYRGEIRAVKIGASVRIPAAEVDRLLGGGA